jgi:RNA polymerase sigma-54 factor
MAFSPKLELRHSQSLVLTPQLRQAIKLLQLSNLELHGFIEAEIEQNPLLVREDPEGESEAGDSPGGSLKGEETARDAAVESGAVESGAVESGTVESGAAAAGEASAEGAPAVPDAVEFTSSDRLAEGDEPLDADFAELWDSGSPNEAIEAGVPAYTVWGSGGRSDFAENERGLEDSLCGKIGLLEHLARQLQLEIEDPIDRAIGMQLIDLIDEAGYLPPDLSPVAARLNCGLSRIERTLKHLQGFDPPGVFARDLSECLTLQLKDRNRFDPAMGALLDHLDLLARHDIDALRKLCGVDEEDFAEMVAEIRSLDPKPGLAFDFTITQPVIPDILVRPRRGGGWHIELNNETLPRVLVNNRYHAQIRRHAKTRKEKEYVADRLASANWLVRSLHQRMTTILKVATEITRRQEAFLAKGVQHLRPLVLRDIAEAIGMHESTVSRATTNKFMATPRGVYELKYFFSAALAGAAPGESHSAEAVRARLQEMIHNESVDDVLSDDRLVEMLAREGIRIARRTVAKYRESLRLPSSVQRRREKSRRF